MHNHKKSILVLPMLVLLAASGCSHTNSKENPVPELKGFEAPVQDYNGATVFEHTWIPAM